MDQLTVINSHSERWTKTDEVVRLRGLLWRALDLWFENRACETNEAREVRKDIEAELGRN